MKLCVSIFVFLSMFSINCNANDKDLEPLIVSDSGYTYPVGTLPKNSNWVGLTCKNSICKIKPYLVNIVEVVRNDYTISNDEEFVYEKIDTKENLESEEYTLALFTNIKIPISSNIIASKVTEIPVESVDSHKGIVARWSVGESKDKVIIYATKHYNERGFDYFAKKRNKVQKMFSTSADEDSPSNVVSFAGDLDRDGVADLLFFENNSCSAGGTLYLSSYARAKQLFGLVKSRTDIWAEPCGC